MPPEFLILFPYYTIYCGYSMLAGFEYMILDRYTCHLVSFCTHWVAFWQPWTCIFRFWSLNQGGHFSWGPGLPRGASRSDVVSSHLALLARFSLSARVFLSFIPCIAYFCVPWWCNNYIILCHCLWWLSTCTFVLECILLCTFILWLLYCTDA